jgi:hypothetical protein
MGQRRRRVTHRLNLCETDGGLRRYAPNPPDGLIIDLVAVAVLMSMGMMMLPPVVVSLPFKLIFFVLVDGWSLVAGSLVQSYSGSG